MFSKDGYIRQMQTLICLYGNRVIVNVILCVINVGIMYNTTVLGYLNEYNKKIAVFAGSFSWCLNTMIR